MLTRSKLSLSNVAEGKYLYKKEFDMAQNKKPLDPRRRHFFRAVAAAGAMIPLSLVLAKESGAAVFGDPPRGPPGSPPGGPPGGTHCLLPGTKILTERGEVTIEHLRVGDRVMTGTGDFRPIKGIGRNTFQKEAVARWSEDIAPIRIAASAISPGVPAQDIYVSPGHALFIDGHLIPAKYLVNGLTITQEELSERDVVEYLHLVFERHEVFYAAGLAVESLRVSYAGEPKDRFIRYEDDGSVIEPMVSYAPLLGYFGGRQEVIAFARLTVYPWIDVRDRIQAVYDRLSMRARQVYAEFDETSLAA
jgi:hypothetical protein